MGNAVKQVYTNGGYTAERVMDGGEVDHAEGTLWDIKASAPDEHHVCDIRGEANAIAFLQSVVARNRGLKG